MVIKAVGAAVFITIMVNAVDKLYYWWRGK